MIKNILKFASLGLLLLCIVFVPLFGFMFEDYDSPSIFSDNAVVASKSFGGGTTVYLKPVDGKTLTAESYLKAAETLQLRLHDMGNTDATAVANGNEYVKVEVSQKVLIEQLFATVASVGEWALIGSSSEALATADMIKNVEVMTSAQTGGYVMQFEFTEDGAAQFKANTASYSISSANIYLTIDGNYVGMATVSADMTTKLNVNLLSFSANVSESVSLWKSMILNGSLPSAFEVDSTEPIAPTYSCAVRTVIYVALALIVLASIAFFLVKGRVAGLSASAALISTISIILIALVNKTFALNLANVIAFAICLIAVALFYSLPLRGAGDALKLGKKVDLRPFTKLGLKALWIHALIFAVSVAVLFIVTNGYVLQVANLVMLFSLASISNYFIFIFFPAHTLSK